MVWRTWKMGFCKSDQKSMPVAGFLACNDCDVLRAKTGVYRQVTHRTIILPTLFWAFLMEKWHLNVIQNFPTMYIVSHTKGLARYFMSFFFVRPSLLLNTTFSTSFVSLGPTGAWPLPCAAAFPHSIGFLQLLYHLLQHSPCTPIPVALCTS